MQTEYFSNIYFFPGFSYLNCILYCLLYFRTIAICINEIVFEYIMKYCLWSDCHLLFFLLLLLLRFVGSFLHSFLLMSKCYRHYALLHFYFWLDILRLYFTDCPISQNKKANKKSYILFHRCCCCCCCYLFISLFHMYIEQQFLPHAYFTYWVWVELHWNIV